MKVLLFLLLFVALSLSRKSAKEMKNAMKKKMANRKRYAPDYVHEPKRRSIEASSEFDCSLLKYTQKSGGTMRSEYKKDGTMQFMYGYCNELFRVKTLNSNSKYLIGMKDVVIKFTDLASWDDAYDQFKATVDDLLGGIINADYKEGKKTSQIMKDVSQLTIVEGKKVLEALQVREKTSWFSVNTNMVILKDLSKSGYKTIRGYLVKYVQNVNKLFAKYPDKEFPSYNNEIIDYVKLGNAFALNMWITYKLEAIEDLGDDDECDCDCRRSGLLEFREIRERRNIEETEVPAEWTCDISYYNDTVFCDCDCGIWDPDCDLPFQEGDEYWNCDYSDERLIPVGCNTTGHGCLYEAAPVPPEWTCDISYYNSSDGCDCGCGIIDPDCYDPSQIIFGCDDGGGPTCNATGQCEYVEVPTEWTCHPTFYASGDGCDCDCGVQDPDCDNMYVEGIFEDLIPYNCETGEDVKCVAGQCTYGRLIPDGWTCDTEQYGDGICDCDCGVWDIDCDVNTIENENTTIGENMVVLGCPCVSMQCVNDPEMGPTCQGNCGTVLFFAPVSAQTKNHVSLFILGLVAAMMMAIVF